jgi:hypothetical protein
MLPAVVFSTGTTPRSASPPSTASKTWWKVGKPRGMAPGKVFRRASSL